MGMKFKMPLKIAVNAEEKLVSEMFTHQLHIMVVRVGGKAILRQMN
jgi:hypothetical protein